jgi:hypothetical protein
VVDDDDLTSRSMALSVELSELSHEALRDTKRAINLGLLQQSLAALEMSAAAETGSFDTDEHAARLAKLLEDPKSES